ncbi:hypothetical protein SOVF_078240 [Spinacia oleracea]|nr:hypothetical protein SOVF_078240 [Spinacia oleracea]
MKQGSRARMYVGLAMTLMFISIMMPYVCGEETTLLGNLEGKNGNLRLKALFRADP